MDKEKITYDSRIDMFKDNHSKDCKCDSCDVHKDIKRRLDRLEQCIYMLSISDDVKSIDIKKALKSIVHEMYGEHQASHIDESDLVDEDINY